MIALVSKAYEIKGYWIRKMEQKKVDPVPEVEVLHAEEGEKLTRYHIEKHEPHQLPYTTQSICPECMLSDDKVTVIDATLYEEDGKVMYKKSCDLHGEFVDVYWGDVDMWKKAMSYWYKNVGLDNPRTETVKGCPEDCGQCPEHKKKPEIVEEETSNLGTFQNFAVLHNDKATGIKKGERVYGNIITVRIVVSEDAVTAKAKQVPYNILEKISQRITSEIPSVVRCLYDITHKPPATIEFE